MATVWQVGKNPLTGRRFFFGGTKKIKAVNSCPNMGAVGKHTMGHLPAGNFLAAAEEISSNGFKAVSCRLTAVQSDYVMSPGDLWRTVIDDERMAKPHLSH